MPLSSPSKRPVGVPYRQLAGAAAVRLPSVRALAAVAVLFLPLLPAAHSHAEEPTLTVVAPWEIKGFDPAVTGYAFTRMEVAETFVEVDEEGRPIPALARAWSVSEEGRLWRFTVRPGVRFHDGTALTADHVVHSLEVARGKPGVLDKAPIEQGVFDLLRRLRLQPGLLDRRPTEISGGELQRLALLRVLLLDPVFLFADEPTSRLDLITQKETIRLLVEFCRERDCALLLVSHDRDLVSKTADRVVEMGHPDSVPAAAA